MDDEPTKGLETLGEAARRLLRRIDARKKVPGRLEAPGEIHGNRVVSLVAVKAEREASCCREGAGLKLPAPVARCREESQRDGGDDACTGLFHRPHAPPDAGERPAPEVNILRGIHSQRVRGEG